MIESTRTVRGRISVERRYYLSSAVKSAQVLLAEIRSHWEVENKLHWVLDVVFKEDSHRVRAGHAPENLSVLRQFSLNLLRRVEVAGARGSLKGRRKQASWNEDFLVAVLMTL